jgi:putative heme-binding domain-containing protein
LDDGLLSAIRNACSEPSLRAVCGELLSTSPKDVDYELYLSLIESSDRNTWAIGWKGMSGLNAQSSDREFLALSKLVSAALNSTIGLPRANVLSRFRSVASSMQKSNVPISEKWTDWENFFQQNLDPTLLKELVQPKTAVDWQTVMRESNNLKGDVQRGKVVYQARCGICHGGQSALGPSLVGVAKRFSRDDLARAIFEPSRDISDRYRAVRVLTVDDEVLTGMVIYNAADGVTLQAGDGSILRINQDNISEKAYSTESLMPAGLLDDRTNLEIADLFAYLSSL